MESLMNRFFVFSLIAMLLVSAFVSCLAQAADVAGHGAWRFDAVDVAPVWAGHQVGFALLTHGNQQFVAYYGADRSMTLAQRTLGDKTWKYKVLPTAVGWDSHNYVTMAFDQDNYLHVSGNMHVVPLVYFRANKPLDIESVEPVNRMIGQDETHVTYPVFLKGPSGELLFSYRSGKSGNGDNLFNIYDTRTKSWRRLLNTPLMDGEGKMSAYMNGPEKGPDGYYHVSWVWRNTPDASTCHDLSYMRSRDMVHWETIDGRPLTLPIRFEDKQVVVDPIPVQGGIINGMGRVGFDANQHVVLSYAKFDNNGITQLYFAQFENGAWKSYQAADWKKRIEFQGKGTLVSDLSIGPVALSNGQLTVSLKNKDVGSGVWSINPQTMRLGTKVPPEDIDYVYHDFANVESSFPGMAIRWSQDIGDSNPVANYRLRWESLSSNHDAPRDPPYPPPSMLRVISATRD
jgi:hypothetical protein